MNKWKKETYRNKNFIGSIAFFIALAALVMGIIYGFGKKTDVYAKESADEYTVMLENLEDMERVLEESKEAILLIQKTQKEALTIGEEARDIGEKSLNVGEKSLNTGEESLRVGEESLNVEEENLRVSEESLKVSENSLKVSEDSLKKSEEISKKLVSLQKDISDNKADILKAMEDLDEGNKKELEKTYIKISQDYLKVSEEFDASMNSVKDAISQLSVQSNNEYESIVEKIDTLQQHLLQGNEDLQESITQGNESLQKSIDQGLEREESLIGKVINSVTQLNTDLTSTNDRCAQMETEISELKKSLDEVSTQVNNLDRVYPVGSLYLSLSDTNPSVLFGGTWEKVAEGKNLMGAGNASYPLGSSGGDYTGVLSVSNLPNYALTVNDPGHSHSVSTSGGNHTHSISVSGGNHTHNITVTGGNHTHNYSVPVFATENWDYEPKLPLRNANSWEEKTTSESGDLTFNASADYSGNLSLAGSAGYSGNLTMSGTAAAQKTGITVTSGGGLVVLIGQVEERGG